jgi:hypothetical protein
MQALVYEDVIWQSMYLIDNNRQLGFMTELLYVGVDYKEEKEEKEMRGG